MATLQYAASSKLVDKVQDLIQLLGPYQEEGIANVTADDDATPSKSWAIDPDKKKEEFRNYDDKFGDYTVCLRIR